MDEGLVYIGLFNFAAGILYSAILIVKVIQRDAQDIGGKDILLAISCLIFGAAVLGNDPGYFIDWVNIGY